MVCYLAVVDARIRHAGEEPGEGTALLILNIKLKMHSNFTLIELYTQNFGVMKYSYPQAIVLATVDYLPKNPRAKLL